MELFLFIFINIITSYYFFFISQKNLHPLEIFSYWCFSCILFQNYSALLYMTYSKIIISDVALLGWADTLNRVILLPLLMVWFLNLYVNTGFTQKLILGLLFTSIITGIEVISVWLGIMEYQGWSIIWSLLFKLCILIISILYMKIFRYFLYRKVNTNEL